MFETLSFIGRGGYGNVYKCRNTKTGREYAVKSIGMIEYGIRNLNELAIMSSFRHPHIMRMKTWYFDHIRGVEYLHVVMPLGTSDFAKLCRVDKGGRAMSLPDVRKYGWQIASAILNLHGQGIIHTDIKLSNVIMIDNNAVLSDFGLSLREDERKEFNYNIGTPHHRPPEMWSGQLWNRSVDIWSFGCALYEMAFGEIPIPEQKNSDSHELEKLRYLSSIQRFCSAFPEPCRSYRDQIIDVNNVSVPNNKILLGLANHQLISLCDLISKMMHYNPRDRYTITQVMGHPFFAGCTLPNDTKYVINLPKNSDSIGDIITPYTTSLGAVTLAQGIYSRLKPDIIARNRNLYAITCYIMSCKLRGIPINTNIVQNRNIRPESIRQTEKVIITELNFHLYGSK